MQEGQRRPGGGLGGLFGGNMNAEQQAMMLKLALGMQDDPKAIREEGFLLGRTQNRAGFESFGVLGVRLLGPTLETPEARLILETNGIISTNPHKLKELAIWMGTASQAIEADYESEVQKAKNFDTTKLLADLMGGTR